MLGEECEVSGELSQAVPCSNSTRSRVQLEIWQTRPQCSASSSMATSPKTSPNSATWGQNIQILGAVAEYSRSTHHRTLKTQMIENFFKCLTSWVIRYMQTKTLTFHLYPVRMVRSIKQKKKNAVNDVKKVEQFITTVCSAHCCNHNGHQCRLFKTKNRFTMMQTYHSYIL